MYAMLTGDSADEMMREYEREDTQEAGREYDQYRDIDYDMDAIRKGLALASIDYLEQEIVDEHKTLIQAIKFIKTGRPRFYNYTTDHYVAEYTINAIELDKYIEQNREAVESILSGYTNRYDVNLVDNIYHAAVCHLIDNNVDRDHYNMAMWEQETEIYYENMQWSDENEANNKK
jgi:hypothetical protein